MFKEDKENAINGKQKDSVREGDKCSFQHDVDKRAKPTPKTAPHHESPKPRGRRASRKKSPRGWSPPGKTNRQQCQKFLKGTCTKSPCEDWDPPECQFYKSESGCIFGDMCSFAHRQVDGQPSGYIEKCTTVGLRPLRT